MRLCQPHRRRRLFGKKYKPLERRKTRLMIFIILWGIIFTWLVKSFVLNLEVVKGESMHPNFQKGSFYLVNMFIFNFTEPQRGDVIIIKNIPGEGEEQLIKRIIGVPGDVIEIKGGDVYLNGRLLDEPYVRGRTFPDMAGLRIKEDMYFVMGDNREISDDSRHFGSIEKNRIRGKLAPGRLFALR